MRYVFGLVLAGGLILGSASQAQAQVNLSIGNPYGYNGLYTGPAAYGFGYNGLGGSSFYNSNYYGPGVAAPYVGLASGGLILGGASPALAQANLSIGNSYGYNALNTGPAAYGYGYGYNGLGGSSFYSSNYYGPGVAAPFVAPAYGGVVIGRPLPAPAYIYRPPVYWGGYGYRGYVGPRVVRPYPLRRAYRW